jgi:fermentation-respiration switch protein FrsA (DUF1100 family)
MANLDAVAPRPVMLVTGAEAHPRYYSEAVHGASPNNTELVVVPNADHVDLYDRTDRIPFGQLEAFFLRHLK